MKLFPREISLNCDLVDRETKRKSKKTEGSFRLLTLAAPGVGTSELEVILNEVRCGWRNLLIVKNSLYAQHPEKDFYVEVPAHVVGHLYVTGKKLENLFFILDIQSDKFVLQPCKEGSQVDYFMPLTQRDVGKRVMMGNTDCYVKAVNTEDCTVTLWDEDVRKHTCYPWTALLKSNVVLSTEPLPFIQELAQSAERRVEHITTARVSDEGMVVISPPPIREEYTKFLEVYPEYQRMSQNLTEAIQHVTRDAPRDSAVVLNDSVVLLPVGCLRNLLEVCVDISPNAWLDVTNPDAYFERSRLERTFTGYSLRVPEGAHGRVVRDADNFKLGTLRRRWVVDELVLHLQVPTDDNDKVISSVKTSSPSFAREQVLNWLEQHFEKVAVSFRLVTFKDSEGRLSFQALPYLAIR